MLLFEIKRELEIENDLINLSAEDLVRKYGRDTRESILFLNQLNRLFKNDMTFTDSQEEILDKIEEVAEAFNNSSDMGLVTSRASSILSKVRNRKEELLDDEYLGAYLSLLNDQLGISRLDESVWNYKEIVGTLRDEFRRYEKYRDSTLPDTKEARKVFGEVYKERKAGKYINLKGGDNKVEKIYEEYPLMNLCFDKYFLVLSNYLLVRTSLDDKEKRQLADVTNQVINMTVKLAPVCLSEDFDIREYERISSYTHRNTRPFEAREEKVKSSARMLNLRFKKNQRNTQE